jgi:hypothetical protein
MSFFNKKKLYLSKAGVPILILVQMAIITTEAKAGPTQDQLEKEIVSRKSPEHQAKMIKNGTTLELVTKKREEKDAHHAHTKSPTLLLRPVLNPNTISTGKQFFPKPEPKN